MFYRAAYVVQAGSPLTSLASLRGKRVAFVSKTSKSGYLFAREMLSKESLNPEGFFAEEVRAGAKSSVTESKLESPGQENEAPRARLFRAQEQALNPSPPRLLFPAYGAGSIRQFPFAVPTHTSA